MLKVTLATFIVQLQIVLIQCWQGFQHYKFAWDIIIEFVAQIACTAFKYNAIINNNNNVDSEP